MKLVILAGGLGSRISEETSIKPKALIEIGSMPIIVHIMKYYSFFGVREFIICCGYKGYLIKDYFINYYYRTSNICVDLQNQKVRILNENKIVNNDWKINLIDTGENTETGGRIKRIKEFVGKDENFFMTYADSLSNVNLHDELKFHLKSKRIATLAAVKPPGRFGSLIHNRGVIKKFSEKPQGDGIWINGGYFILNKKVFEYIDGDQTIWEQQPLQRMLKKNKLGAFEHEGFWQCMDTLKDKRILEKLWTGKKKAPWLIW